MLLWQCGSFYEVYGLKENNITNHYLLEFSRILGCNIARKSAAYCARASFSVASLSSRAHAAWLQSLPFFFAQSSFLDLYAFALSLSTWCASPGTTLS